MWLKPQPKTTTGQNAGVQSRHHWPSISHAEFMDQGLSGLHGQHPAPLTNKPSNDSPIGKPLPFAVRRLLFSEMASRLSQLAYLAYLLIPSLAQAQPIIPAADGTRTTITSKDGKQFDIGGGEVSGDGGNLFHSFQQLGLSPDQTANFLSTPAIRNILARVTGGIPSVIDGLIQVSGGTPNLFLMNPAGIMFGQNAQLNVPASFLATTANGIGFDNGEWFSATGTSNYALLTGTPNTFSFPTNPASVVNQGHLAVGAGQTLTLLGGSVISTGTLEAPGGQIHLVAVPGEGVVRISQTGHLLSLEIAAETPAIDSGTAATDAITPSSLPEMLTGGDKQNQATGVAINEAGQVVLTGGNQPVTPGQVVVTGTLSAATVSQPTLEPGGSVTILGDRITLQSATVDVSGQGAGGTVQVGAAEEQRPASVWGAHTYLSPDSVITADAQGRGTGGQIQVNGIVDLHGQFQARGGQEAGAGGRVQVTGTGNFSGSVDVSAVNGEVGTVQLQSETITVTPEPVQTGFVDQLQVPETTLENLTLNANVTVSATQDIVIQNLPDHQLTFQSQPNNQHPITFMADSDGDGSGSFMVLNTQDQIFTQGNHLSISGERVQVGGIQANGGNIQIQTNQLELAGGRNSIQSPGGQFELETRALYQPIHITNEFDGTVHSLQLTSDEIATLADGFAAIKIGNPEQTASVTLDESVTVQDPLILAGQTVTINENLIGVDDASVTVNGNTTYLGSEISTENQDIIINSDVKLTGNVSLNTDEGAGQIQVKGNITSTVNGEHDLVLNAGAGDIAIEGNVGETFSDQIGRFSVTSANNLTLSDLRVRSFQQTQGLSTTNIEQITTTGGDVHITTQGDINTGTITTQGGAIALTSQTGAITATTLDSSVSQNPSGTQVGGIIALNAAQGIQAKVLNSWGVERGGNIDLNSATGEITVQSIQSGSESGIGGRVSISADPVSSDPETESNLSQNPNAATSQAVTPLEINSSLNLAMALETSRTQEFITAFGSNSPEFSKSQDLQTSLRDIAAKTGKNSAVIYVISQPDGLELVLITAEGASQIRQIPQANPTALKQQIGRLIGNVSQRPDPNHPDAYLSASQQLYQWLIAPLESELQTQGIDTLMFSLDPGMRSLPLATLHDGNQFLVEKYSLSLIPSLNLTDQRYQNLHSPNSFSLLAMGAAQFQDQHVVPLPAVPIELSTITQDWPGHAFLNDQFTLNNLIAQRTATGSPIVHLATHGFFDPENPSQSYLQLWDSQLNFEELRQLSHHGDPIELLVLSACETAFGSTDRELGFAGLAVQSGVKSVMASLWQVDDAGTLGLMSEFYRQLSHQSKTYKAEALRQAQIAMITGNLRVEAGQLRSVNRGQTGVPLPSTANADIVTLSHPYYWASFTMVGSPW